MEYADWQTEIDTCFREKQWRVLQEYLTIFLNSQDQYAINDCLRYIDSCVDCFFFGKQGFPKRGRFFRASISSSPFNYPEINIDSENIEIFDQVITSVCSKIDNLETQEKLRIIIEHLYSDPAKPIFDVISRYKARFDNVDYDLVWNNNIEWTKRQLDIFCFILKTDPMKLRFEDVIFVVRSLSWMYCNTNVTSEKPHSHYQLTLDTIKQIGHLAFSINKRMCYDVEEFLTKHSQQMMSSNNIVIKRLTFGYDRNVGKPILTIEFNI